MINDFTLIFPFASRLAVWEERAVIIGADAVHFPVAGSYSSVDARVEEALNVPLSPPLTKTLPLGRRVAVCSLLELGRLPVVVQLPVDGL